MFWLMYILAALGTALALYRGTKKLKAFTDGIRIPMAILFGVLFPLTLAYMLVAIALRDDRSSRVDGIEDGDKN